MVTRAIDIMMRRAVLVVNDRRATESVARAAWRHLEQLRSSHGHLGDEALAHAAVQRVVSEARAHPPASALRVRIESSDRDADTGIWSEHGMTIVLRWFNRASFAVELKQITGTVNVTDAHEERTFTLIAPVQFEIPPQSDVRLVFAAVLDRKVPPARYAQTSVAGEVSLEALVMGPWPDAPHHVQQFRTGRASLPIALELVHPSSSI
jgi:hypothetical protein